MGLNTIVIPLYLECHKKSRLCDQTFTIFKWKQTNSLKKLFIFWSAYHHHLFRFRHKARRVSSAVLKEKVAAFTIRVLHHQTHAPCPLRALGSLHEVWTVLLPVSPFQSGLITTFSHCILWWLCMTLCGHYWQASQTRRMEWAHQPLHRPPHKEVRLCFLKVLHIHPNTSRHIQNHSKSKQFVSQHFRYQAELSACSWPQHPQAHIQCAS